MPSASAKPAASSSGAPTSPRARHPPASPRLGRRGGPLPTYLPKAATAGESSFKLSS